MREPFWIRTGAVTSSLLAFSIPVTASAQETAAPPPNQIEEIVVTAQKREQSANTVGMSITAATGDVLRRARHHSVAELTRLVPGLTIQESSFNSTSFTLRGVGFFNSDLATPPAVTVYVDEAPLPYPAMTKLAAFDLARVEVLKGPQGTLFGLNATGGAVQLHRREAYRGSRDEHRYGLRTSSTACSLGGFVSGPITDRVSARVAVQGRQRRRLAGKHHAAGRRAGRSPRAAKPRDARMAPRRAAHVARCVDSHARPIRQSRGSVHRAGQPRFRLWRFLAYSPFPVVTEPRAADWATVRPDTGEPFPYDSDTTLDHVSWRNDYELEGGITLTSLTSYASFDLAYGQDPDGTPFHVSELIDRDGEVSAFFQEVRVCGRTRKSQLAARRELRARRHLGLLRSNSSATTTSGASSKPSIRKRSPT